MDLEKNLKILQKYFKNLKHPKLVLDGDKGLFKNTKEINIYNNL